MTTKTQAADKLEARADAPVVIGTASSLDTSAAAAIAPATEFNPSGAPIQTVPDVDPAHPAVDNDPRAGTTVNQNKIDFNDPGLTGAEAVERNLKAQASA